MPDIIAVIGNRWKLIFLLTLVATGVALVATLFSPKLYLSTATALPANSALNDKARIFNTNIEGLYPSLGSPDELDRMEGTTKLDTLFIAMANDFNLAAYYGITNESAVYKAALKFKKGTDISRSAYGELKIKVWDKGKGMAAELANAYLQKLNAFHQHLQNANNIKLLQKMKDDVAAKQKQLLIYEDKTESYKSNKQAFEGSTIPGDTTGKGSGLTFRFRIAESAILLDEIKEYQKLINQYELSIQTTPDVLIVVEAARPALKWDKPNILRNLAFAFIASLLFSFLLALFIESRNKTA